MIWILRFVPHAGGNTIDSCFRDKNRAEKQYADACQSVGRVCFIDDYGIKASYNPAQGGLILTNTEASARLGQELTEANREAVRQTGSTGRTLIDPGSTVQ